MEDFIGNGNLIKQQIIESVEDTAFEMAYEMTKPYVKLWKL